jgi:hypothetical protein
VSKNVVDAKFLFSDVSEEASNSTCPKTISHLSTQISIHHIRDSGAKRLPREMDVQDMNQDQWSKSFDYGDEHAERFSLRRPNMYFLICKIGIFAITISKQFLQLSCLDAQIPQQKLPPRLHNNVCFLSQRNATRGSCLSTIPQNHPPSHNDLAILGSTINHLPFAACECLSSLASPRSLLIKVTLRLRDRQALDSLERGSWVGAVGCTK